MHPQNPALVGDAASSIIDWYWSFGVKRRGEYTLSRSAWLSAAYEAKKSAQRMAALPVNGRKTMGIWGPSASGKSTLLSACIDKPDGRFASALQWRDTDRVAFVNDSGSGIKLNPYRFKMDASGCVSRFVLTDKVSDEFFPVELVLAQPDQILEALAIGFMTECAGGWERLVTPEEILKIVDDADNTARGRSASRPAFELVHDFVTVVDDLVLAGWSVYLPLAARWQEIRHVILKSEGLAADKSTAELLVTSVFWGGDRSLLRTFDELLRVRSDLAASSSLRSSYELAAEILDISSAASYEDRGRGSIYGTKTGGSLCLGFTGDRVIANRGINFAHLQAVIWEMRIPLNSETLRRTAPEIAKELNEFDIVDFPGVSLEGDGGSKEEIAHFKEIDVFTRLFKRGKTASIVVSYSSSYAIDGFSILIRAGTPLAQPRQLIAGLRAWTNALAVNWPPKNADLPLNVVLTFCAALINDVASTSKSGRNIDGAGDVLKWLESIQGIADPTWARFWVTSYPQLKDGIIEPPTTEALKIADRLMEFEGFRDKFVSNPDNIHQMVKSSDGGVLQLLKGIGIQVRNSRLHAIRAERIDQIIQALLGLCEEGMPSQESDHAIRAADLKAWQREILDRLHQLSTEDDSLRPSLIIGDALLKVFSLPDSALDPIPLNATTGTANAYLQSVIFNRWIEYARDQKVSLAQVGLSDPAHFNRRLEYLAQFLFTSGRLTQWLCDFSGKLSKPEDAAHARTYLSMKICDALISGTGRSATLHRETRESEGKPSPVFVALAELAAGESGVRSDDLENTAHFRGVIQPFFENLDVVSASRSRIRDKQQGDQEMVSLAQSVTKL